MLVFEMFRGWFGLRRALGSAGAGRVGSAGGGMGLLSSACAESRELRV